MTSWPGIGEQFRAMRGRPVDERAADEQPPIGLSAAGRARLNARPARASVSDQLRAAWVEHGGSSERTVSFDDLFGRRR